MITTGAIHIMLASSSGRSARRLIRRAAGEHRARKGRDEMGIERVGHVVIKMRDLEKAKQFYQGVLGMEIGAEAVSGYRRGTSFIDSPQ